MAAKQVTVSSKKILCGLLIPSIILKRYVTVMTELGMAFGIMVYIQSQGMKKISSITILRE